MQIPDPLEMIDHAALAHIRDDAADAERQYADSAEGQLSDIILGYMAVGLL